jgi:DNA mismatch endonuclease (patch repair protein)
MSDIWTKEKRSEVMARIRGKNTKPELFLRSALHRLGYRFRLHARNLPGSPDIFLPRYKCVVFVNGCFWHAHKNCPKFKVPSSNKAFWMKKLRENVTRDLNKSKAIRKMGIKVIVVWECQLKAKPQDSINKVIRILDESKGTIP